MPAGVPPPGPHGGDADRVARALGLDPAAVLDLSASLNPLAPDVATRAACHLDRLRRYPDPALATAALGEALGVTPGRLVLTNGGAEAIALVAALEPCGWVEEPDFSLYRRHLAHLDRRGRRWRSDPRNPTGELAGPAERAGVWDEAFYPLATGRWTRPDDGSWRVGSLTKLWACPGLRLGYVVAPDEGAAARLAARQPRWAVNGLALALAPELLDATDLPAWASGVAALRAELAARLGALGLVVDARDAPWVLVHDAPGLRARLAARGVVVRDCSSFGLPGTARLAVPPPDALDRVVAAVAAAVE